MPGASTSSGAISVQGTLNAVGTAKEPITFTSIDDNSVGGETGTGKPKADDWSGIESTAGGSIDVQHASLNYAGAYSDAVHARGTGALTVINDSFKEDDLDTDGPASPVIETTRW